jgi:hypothetical protein
MFVRFIILLLFKEKQLIINQKHNKKEKFVSKRNLIMIVMSVFILLPIAVYQTFLSQGEDEHQENTSVVALYPTPSAVDITPEPSASVPTPTLEPTGQVTISYKLTDVIREEMFGGTFVEQETITYKRNDDGSWPQVKGTPIFLDYGPLFKMFDYEPLMTTSGDCGINVYPTEGYSPVRIFQPLCQNIPSETFASVTFGLEKCELGPADSIVCGIDTSSGRLNYKLNKNMDKFEFNYAGSWSYIEYPTWINQAISTLGFSPVPDDFYDDVAPGANETIYKNPK